MQRPWTKHHRIIYLLAGCARVDGEPDDAVLTVVFDCIGEFMNLGILPMDDEVFQPIWSEVWLQQHDDRAKGASAMAEKAVLHASQLRREVDASTAQFVVVLGLVKIAKATGQPSPTQMLYVAACGQALGVG